MSAGRVVVTGKRGALEVNAGITPIIDRLVTIDVNRALDSRRKNEMPDRAVSANGAG